MHTQLLPTIADYQPENPHESRMRKLRSIRERLDYILHAQTLQYGDFNELSEIRSEIRVLELLDESIMRKPLDAYQTPEWQTRVLLQHLALPLDMCIIEPCCGDGSIANVLRSRHQDLVATNDIDPRVEADEHINAAGDALYEWADGADWVITNPPYTMPRCLIIVQHAVKNARVGVAMLLRLSFLEPTQARGAWLAQHPPSQMIVLPRTSYTGNGKTDSVTTAWMIWRRERRSATPNRRQAKSPIIVHDKKS